MVICEYEHDFVPVIVSAKRQTCRSVIGGVEIYPRFDHEVLTAICKKCGTAVWTEVD